MVTGGGVTEAWIMALVAQRGITAGHHAVGAAVPRLAAAAQAEMPAIAVESGDDFVRLRGPGLVARAFGTQRHAPDPRIAALLATLTGGRR